MSNELNSKSDPGQPMVYQIRIKGHLGRQWSNWFEGLAITLQDNGETLLTGPVVDQAALHGLLRKVRDVGMPLLAVNRVTPGTGQKRQISMKRITIVQKGEKNEGNEQNHRNER